MDREFAQISILKAKLKGFSQCREMGGGGGGGGIKGMEGMEGMEGMGGE
jgi:hypothetical protein